MVISLNGTSTEMIWDGADRWRAADDSGWRITHKTAADPNNDDNNGEYWLVQATDGTQYFFGHGSAGGDATRETHSVGTVPVFGLDNDEPKCSDHVGDWCRQAYRWQLDYVVDRHENTTTYFYDRETNHYAMHGDTDRSVSYTSALNLARIEYGQQRNDETPAPPVKVEFNSRRRCKESADEDDPLNTSPATCPSFSDKPSSYPDVPVDLICEDNCKSTQNSPTFFTTSRLNDIHSYVRDVEGKAWDPVAQVQTRMAFPTHEDGSDPSLWLDFVQTRGYAGTNLTSPITNFNGTDLNNRFDHLADGVSPQAQRRITTVVNELGGKTNITYGHPDPCPETRRDAKRNDPSWDHNTDDCFPQQFDPDGEGGQDPGFGVFNKWLVMKVENDDAVGASPTEVWSYAYPGNAAWAYSNSMLFAQGTGDQTWDQWRGYRQVEVTHGAGATQTVTMQKYFRGMDGDHNASGDPKVVTVDDFLGTTWQDIPSRKGRLLQSSTVDGAGTVLAGTRVEYTHEVTADGPGIHNAVMTLENDHYTRERIDGSPDTWRERQVETEYTGRGLPITVKDHGELGVDDNMCTTTGYAASTDTWGDSNYLSLPDNVITYRGECTTGVRVAHTRTYYDGASTLATNVPFDGNPTTTLTFTADADDPTWSTAEATFDKYGRPTSTTSPNETGADSPKRTTYKYVPATGVPIDGITVTNPAGHSSTTYPSRLRAEPNKVKDANDKVTTLEHDAFNRLTSVVLPGDPLMDGPPPLRQPSLMYTYPGSQAGPTTRTTPARVQTQTRLDDDTYLRSYEYVDGFGRTRETQVPSPYKTGTRMVSITRYDSRGLAVGVSPPQYNTDSAGSGLLNPDPADLTAYVHTDYDSRERPITTIQYGAGAETWRTTTAYHGDKVTVNPPVGGNTETYSDVFGRTTKIAEYTTATAHQDTIYAYTYPASGPKTTITDPADKATSFSNDLAGHRITIKDANAGTSTMTYDKNGNLRTTTDPSGTVTTTYDDLDRPTARTATPAGGTATTTAIWLYDPAGATGHLASTTATTVTGVAGTGSLTTKHAVTGYDDRYRPTGATTTLGTNTALGALSGQSYTEKYGYDSADHLVTITYPGVGGLPAETVDTGYSGIGVPTTLKITPTGSTTAVPVITDTAFTGSGLYDGRTWASGATRNLDYDMTIRAPKTVQAYYTPTGGTPVYWQNDTYTRDDGGNITSLTDKVQAPDQSQCFTYDTRNRLTQAWTTNPAVTPCATVPGTAATTWSTGTAPYRTKWSHTSTGNLSAVATASITGTTAAFTNRAYTYADTTHPGAVTSVAPQLGGTTGVDTYAYDTSGRMKSKTVAGIATTLTYNPQQQLITSTSGTAVHKYGYDTDGQRSIKITPTTVTAYFGATELTTPTTGTTAGTITGKRSYTHAGATVALRTGNAALTYLFADLQGSATLSVASGLPATASVSRQRYTPYGATRGAANQLPTDHGWLGQTEDDTTGLTYLNARYYDPILSRFLTPDPLLNAGAPTTHNPYTYALGNPLTFSDATGLACSKEDGDSCVQLPGGKKGTTKKKTTTTPPPSGGASIPNPSAQAAPTAPVAGLTTSVPGAGIVNWFITSYAAFDRFTDRHRIPAEWDERINNGFGAALIMRGRGLGAGGLLPAPAAMAESEALAESGAGKAAVREGCSFAADTLVLMADGTNKLIKDIKVGDKVRATNTTTGMSSPRTVEAVFVNLDTDLLDLMVKTKHGSAVIHTTEGHPLWDQATHTWIRAGQLTHKARLRTPDGGTSTVVSAVAPTVTTGTMWDLTVTADHTFYVLAGETAVLVHNAGFGLCPVNDLPHGKIGEAATLDRLTTEGYSNITPEVSFRTADGVPFRADFVARDSSGAWRAIEAKTGAGAGMTSGQAVGYPALNSEKGAILVTEKLEEFGIPYGSRVTMQVEVDMWSCPECGP
jgi:RHS repeat-associated protein